MAAAAGTSDDRPAGITCPTYARGDGKRCRHYLPKGGCALPGESLCVEWRKANGHLPQRGEARALPLVDAPKPLPPPGARDLFGNPLPESQKPPPAPAPAAPPPKPQADDTPAFDVHALCGLTPDDVASFKALGVEVCLHSETLGEVWLVPAYTGQPRTEVTPEHVALLLHVLSVFPGARLLAFNKPPNPERQERPYEERS